MVRPTGVAITSASRRRPRPMTRPAQQNLRSAIHRAARGRLRPHRRLKRDMRSLGSCDPAAAEMHGMATAAYRPPKAGLTMNRKVRSELAARAGVRALVAKVAAA